jgi:hypothetical protein
MRAVGLRKGAFDFKKLRADGMSFYGDTCRKRDLGDIVILNRLKPAGRDKIMAMIIRRGGRVQ